jgi:hypothetical protein
MNKVCALSAFIILMISAFFAPTCAFAMDELDLSVGLKILALLDNKISGDVPLAIIYDAKLPESQTEANSLYKTITGSFQAPAGVKLSVLMVATDDLSKLSSAKVGIVSKGSCTNAVAEATARQGILTMTSDLNCVKANRSILGITTHPGVEIYFSRTAADAARVGFSQAFIMIAERV